jgi:hypothetical protein
MNMHGDSLILQNKTNTALARAIIFVNVDHSFQFLCSTILFRFRSIAVLRRRHFPFAPLIGLGNGISQDGQLNNLDTIILVQPPILRDRVDFGNYPVVHPFDDPPEIRIRLVGVFLLLGSRPVVLGVVLDGNIPTGSTRSSGVSRRVFGVGMLGVVFLERHGFVALGGFRLRCRLQDVAGVAMELSSHVGSGDLHEVKDATGN